MNVPIPELERHCGSWVAARDGRAVCETFSRHNAQALANRGFQVVTAAQWLGQINAQGAAQ